MLWPPPSLNRRRFAAMTGSAAAFLAAARGQAHAQEAGGSGTAVPGAEVSAKSRMLEMGADLLQSKRPIDDINMYLNGFRFYCQQH